MLIITDTVSIYMLPGLQMVYSSEMPQGSRFCKSTSIGVLRRNQTNIREYSLYD